MSAITTPDMPVTTNQVLLDLEVARQVPDLSQLNLGYYDTVVAQKPIYELDQETSESTGEVTAFSLVIENSEGELERRYYLQVPAILVREP